jgi:hypothetical protein
MREAFGSTAKTSKHFRHLKIARKLSSFDHVIMLRAATAGLSQHDAL